MVLLACKARRQTEPSFVESRPCLRGPPSRGLGVAGFLVLTLRLPYLRLKGMIRKVRGVFLFGSVYATFDDDKSHLLIDRLEGRLSQAWPLTLSKHRSELAPLGL